MSTPDLGKKTVPVSPPDRGLTHLGLVTEAVGWSQAAVAATMLLSLLAAATASPDMWGNNPQVSEIENRFFMAALVFFVGSLLLAFAGRGLAAGSAVAARIYVAGGSVAGIAFTLTLGKGADTVPLLLACAVALAWPALIAVAVWRRPPSTDPLFAYRFPKPSDGGLAGLQSLMILAATIELVAAAGAFWFATSAPESPWPTVPALVLGFLLFARAILQIIAASVTRLQSAAAIRRYVTFGLSSAAVFVLANAILEWDKEFLIFVLGGAAVLASWPFVVHGYLSRNPPTTASSESPSGDLGLTALAWLLLLLGVREASSLTLGVAYAVVHGSDLTLENLLPAILAVAQVWAGLEVLALSKRMRLAVGLYALCGIGAAILLWREIAGGSTGGIDMAASGGFGALAAATTLALPVASLIVVEKRIASR